jgi:3-hydroxyisobutyrate dehydrogenase-like beta-hydroxyacid dehydrogenase
LSDSSALGFVGFIGTGNMGAPMASRLLDAGYRLVVFDARAGASTALAARGARVAGSVAEVASLATIVFLSLPTPAIVQSVALGAGGLIGGSALKTVVDLSTTGPAVAAAVAKALAGKGISYVDSPVSGGVPGAQKGTLAVMVACAKPAYEQVEPLLLCLGKPFYAGEKAGLAQTAKLANNLLSIAALAVSSEAIAMGVKAGLDPKVLIDIINAGSGRNSATQDKFPRAILTRRFDFGFATGLAYKDLRLCLEEAEALGVKMPVGTAVQQVLALTQEKFGAESDFTSIARVVEESAGVEIKG